MMHWLLDTVWGIAVIGVVTFAIAYTCGWTMVRGRWPWERRR